MRTDAQVADAHRRDALKCAPTRDSQVLVDERLPLDAQTLTDTHHSLSDACQLADAHQRRGSDTTWGNVQGAVPTLARGPTIPSQMPAHTRCEK
jgi:hypothetical protein